MPDPKDLKRARRIVILARTNGFSGLVMGVSTLAVAAVARDPWAILASCGICAAAGIEISGANRASRHDAMAARILVASQVLALSSALALITRCAFVFSPAVALAWMPPSMREAVLMLYPGPGEAGEFLRTGLRVALGLVAIVAVLYEGGMALVYGMSGNMLARLSEGKTPDR